MFGQGGKAKLLSTARQALKRKAFSDEVHAAKLRELEPKPDESDLPLPMLKAMLTQRMQAYLMQDKHRMRRIWRKYDTGDHGILEVGQLHRCLTDLGCDITREETAKFLKRFASKPGMIDFEEFCVNFLGLPVGFFQMNLADSAVFAEDDDEPEKNPNSLKPMLPAGTSIDEVEKRFVYKLRKSLFNVESAIQDGLGKPNSKAKYLRRDDLWNLLQRHKITASRAQLDQIMAYFDHDQDGRITYEELAHELLKLARPAGHRHRVSHGQEPELDYSCAQIVHTLRQNVEKAAANPRRLYQMFRTFDTDGSGEIAFDEFEGMVEELGLRVAGDNSAAELLTRFDKQGRGALSYTEFVTDVLKLKADALAKPGCEGRPSSPELLATVSKGVKSVLQNSAEAVTNAFHRFDTDRGGSISVKEFHDGIQNVGLDMTRQQAKQLFQLFDIDGNGELSKEELALGVLKNDDPLPMLANSSPGNKPKIPPGPFHQKSHVQASSGRLSKQGSHKSGRASRISSRHSKGTSIYDKYATKDSPERRRITGQDGLCNISIGPASETQSRRSKGSSRPKIMTSARMHLPEITSPNSSNLYSPTRDSNRLYGAEPVS